MLTIIERLFSGIGIGGLTVPTSRADGHALSSAHSDRFLALDALRGICACMVVLFHFKTTAPIIALPLVRAGAQFTDFFFVLSGFVIVSSYGAKIGNGFPVSRFILLRLGRIYPLHVVMLAAFVIIECAAAIFADEALVPRQIFDGNHAPEAILTNLAFLQVFGIEGHLTWNVPAWSIAAEF